MIKHLLVVNFILAVTTIASAAELNSVDCRTSNPLSFIRCVAGGNPESFSRFKNDSSSPGFIVYEGNTTEWALPATEKIEGLVFQGSDKIYKTIKSDSFYRNVTSPLTSVNSDLVSTITENMIWIRENITSDVNWPTNQTMSSVKGTTITVEEAFNLLKEKYKLDNIPSLPNGETSESYMNEVAVQSSEAPVTVRQLLWGVMRAFVKTCYVEGLYADRVAAFQIKAVEQPDNSQSLVILFLTVP